MSYLGIDVGTSALKASAYREDGELLASVRVPVYPSRDTAGMETLDPETVWLAAVHALRLLNAKPELKSDPVVALAVSASGDEVFATDARGHALMPCILSGDIRGGDLEVDVVPRRDAKTWIALCGHVPQRMDPVLRCLWLREHCPAEMEKASYLLGWHEFFTLRLVGEAVTDKSLAAKWAVYSSSEGDWSGTMLAEFGLDLSMLPRIAGWGVVVGTLGPSIAAKTGLSVGASVCVGGYDASCAALGAGAATDGIAGLACGSWEVVVAPIVATAIRFPVSADYPIIPFPGGATDSIVAQSANGSSVIRWISHLAGSSLQDAQSSLAKRARGPGPVIAIPHLSGPSVENGGSAWTGGTLTGLSAATEPIDLFQALMEGVVFDLTSTIGRMAEAGTKFQILRATGGGSRSPWWMQLKADLTGVPVEIVEQDEPGAFGAALLSMSAMSNDSAGELAARLTKVCRRYEPEKDRRALYEPRIGAYGDLAACMSDIHERRG